MLAAWDFPAKLVAVLPRPHGQMKTQKIRLALPSLVGLVVSLVAFYFVLLFYLLVWQVDTAKRILESRRCKPVYFWGGVRIVWKCLTWDRWGRILNFGLLFL